jgi:leukotriene-A4 hydrolase
MGKQQNWLQVLFNGMSLRYSFCKTFGCALIISSLFSLASCKDTSEAVDYNALLLSYSGDPHTFAEPEKAVITHMVLDLSVDFSRKKIRGVVEYRIKNNKSETLVLDVKGLKIEKVYVGKDKRETEFTLSKPDSIKGSALTISIGPLTERVEIVYETTAESAALQWLDPEQTAHKVHPFLYTQSQPHLSRTWIPIQDSPGIRFTYEAKVQCPPDLLALMSAENPKEKSPAGQYLFIQKHPVPAYLVALALGDLEFAPIGERTGVYAEPNVIKAAAQEFEKTEQMLTLAESSYGPYRWGRYDLLILPPSFPYGGMENPMLTFVTPTILAGDQSLTSLIAHELAHAWSGNLVTNASWNDFWLNEGFTVYLERRIMEQILGKEQVDLLNVLTRDNLLNLINRMGPDNPDTRLKLDLKDRDPDDAMNRIAYDKGYMVLLLLENTLGREALDSFLKKYFDDFAFQSIDTEKFLEYLRNNLSGYTESRLELREWIYLPGLPANAPVFESAKAKLVQGEIEKLLAKQQVERLDTKNWSAHEWRYFLTQLPKNTPIPVMESLNQTYNLAYSGNSEIRALWLESCTYAGLFPQIQPAMEDFLIQVGRRKYLMPLYQAMLQTDHKIEALSIYRKARSNYHAVSRQSVDALLGYVQ